eukprot:UN28758
MRPNRTNTLTVSEEFVSASPDSFDFHLDPAKLTHTRSLSTSSNSAHQIDETTLPQSIRYRNNSTTISCGGALTPLTPGQMTPAHSYELYATQMSPMTSCEFDSETVQKGATSLSQVMAEMEREMEKLSVAESEGRWTLQRRL